MKPFWKYFLIVMGANALFLLLGFANNDFLIIWLYLFVIQFVLGIILCFVNDAKLVGQAMLLSVGVMFLIGFSVCSIMIAGG